MAFSLFVRGCSSKLLSQNSIRLSCSALQNASTFRMAGPLQPYAAHFLEKSSQQSVLTKMNYSYDAPRAKGPHVTLWIAEKVVAIGLLFITPLAIAVPSKPLDILLAVTLVAHVYWGFEAIVTDYIRAIIFGPIIPKLVHVSIIAVMVATLGGLFYLIFDDIGIGESIRRLWAIKSKN